MTAQSPPAPTPWRACLTNLWSDNPVLRQVLGICSALAVTNLLANTLVMCAGLVFTATLSGMTVSLLRRFIPRQVRMMAQVLIIACFVIIVDVTVRAFLPAMHKVIGPYVGLIITNCILMGRAEAFAMKNPPLASMMDGLGAGLGYSLILLLVAVIRESLGFGTLLGVSLPGRDLWWHPWTVMVMPTGAFFTLAIVAWIAHALHPTSTTCPGTCAK